jgi:hypothetical protein
MFGGGLFKLSRPRSAKALPPLGVGFAYVGLKACLQTCRKRGRLLLTRRRLEPSPSGGDFDKLNHRFAMTAAII